MSLLNHNIMAAENISDKDYCDKLGIDEKHCNQPTINLAIAEKIKELNYQEEYEAAILNGKNAKEADVWAKKVSEKGLADAKTHIKRVLNDRKKNNITYPVDPETTS
jgi:hypothetical protein